ncbi:MAG: hypothetical protein ABFE01_11490 [Phycisphaerales bacterium]
MSGRIDVEIGVVVLICLAIGGCHGSKSRPAEALAAVMRPGMVRPTVGGPHRELPVQRPQEKIVTAALRVFKDSGVELTAAWEPREGLWLLGRSLAGRQVLVDIVPIVPGRFVVRITVEGADQLTRTLLEDLDHRMKARLG